MWICKQVPCVQNHNNNKNHRYIFIIVTLFWHINSKWLMKGINCFSNLNILQLSPIFGLFYTEIFNEHDKIFNYNPEICAVWLLDIFHPTIVFFLLFFFFFFFFPFKVFLLLLLLLIFKKLFWFCCLFKGFVIQHICTVHVVHMIQWNIWRI